MARRMLSLAELKNLDLGKVEAAFRVELGKIVADLCDRPEDPTKRTLSLKLSLWPEDVVAGATETVSVVFTLESRIPKRTTRVHNMRVSGDKCLVFNSESPDNPDQRTLDELVEPPESPGAEKS